MNSDLFRSPLAPFFRRFIGLKRACGVVYEAATLLLRRLDAFLAPRLRRGHRVERGLLDSFVASTAHLRPRSRENLLGVAWQALNYAREHGAPVDALPERPRPARVPARHPYIYRTEELDRLLRAALTLGPRHSLRPHTYATLFALLWVTGLRVGEATALRLADLDLLRADLRVCRGKFGKSRVLPLSATTVEGLRRYLRRRLRSRVPSGPEAPLGPTLGGTFHGHQRVFYAFQQTLRAAGLLPLPGNPRPRIHDFRHSFALHQVLRWYRTGVDVNTRLLALSTYLGHSHLRHTQVYLQPTEEMLQEALRRFDGACGSLIPCRRKSHE